MTLNSKLVCVTQIFRVHLGLETLYCLKNVNQQRCSFSILMKPYTDKRNEKEKERKKALGYGMAAGRLTDVQNKNNNNKKKQNLRSTTTFRVRHNFHDGCEQRQLPRAGVPNKKTIH